VDARKKAELLSVIARQEGVDISQCVSVGDGANDLPMLSAAGLGIAFNAKPAVQAAARYRLNQPTLMPVLYFLGISDADVESLGFDFMI